MASMQEKVAALLKSGLEHVPLTEVLRRPVSSLLGVSTAGAEALGFLDIKTIFDLATSDAFSAANKVLDANSPKNLFYKHGVASSNLVREQFSASIKIDQLKDSGIEALQRVPNDRAASISASLGVSNIREFALYPPYQAAVRILNIVYFPENEDAINADQPADLLPKNGEYPTEKVQYTTLVMDEIKTGPGGIDIGSAEFTPIDLTKLTLEDSGFKQIAYGALITMTQSWYAQGVTLGHLLHSISLAPGESTRTAVVDWTRKSKAGQTETILEDDQLTNESQHNRAMNEVTAATARDAQSGFSHTQQQSSSEQAAAAVEASASYFGLASIDISASYSTANSNASADSYSTSSGSRDLAASMAQNVNDRTHQNAHSTRSRRAAVVKEVSMNEHENISTRVLANYNHMHALTIQYYEVIQIYRTRVTVSKVDKVVFIPIKLVDFTDDTLVQRFRLVLGMVSPSIAIRKAIQEMDLVELDPDVDTVFSRLSDIAPLKNFRDTRLINAGRPLVANPLRTGLNTRLPVINRDGTVRVQGDEPPAIAPAAPAVSATPSLLSANIRTRDLLWKGQVTQLRTLASWNAMLRDDSDSIFLPNDAVIEGFSIDGEGASITAVFGLSIGGTRNTVSAADPIKLVDLSYIAITASAPDRKISVKMQLNTARSSSRALLDLPAVTVAKGFAGTTKIVNIKLGAVKPEVKRFLMANRSYYSLAVYRSLTTTQIALLLSGYVVKIKEPVPGPTLDSPDIIQERSVPVAQVVEPKPIRYVGNYLAFKMTSGEADPDWANWLKNRKLTIGYSTEDIVPLPSGGTFAEAVLGRYNCAEKLDMTRFWNWQDSPVPMVPSEIAAIQAGQHSASDMNPTPSQLSAPIVNMTAPPALPDPSGTGAILAALQNGNMFRDMSGLQGTIGLVQSSTATTTAAATSAGQQASQNMANAMQANTERQRIQAQKEVSMAQMAQSTPNNSKGGLNHSQDGAKMNYHDAQVKVAQGQMPSMGGSGMGVGGGVTQLPAPGGSTAGPSPFGAGGGASWGSAASSNPAFNAAIWGDGAPRSAIIQKAMDGAVGQGNQAMLQNVAFTGNQEEVKYYKDLLDFKVPDSIQKDIATRGIRVQDYDSAMGDLNIDLYQVEITSFPTLPGTQRPATPEEFLFWVRTNFNTVIDTTISSFFPLDPPLDEAKWLSPSPLGAVLRINIPIQPILHGLPLIGPQLSAIVSDNAAVVCSEASPLHWRLSTVETPFRQTAHHPVSGHREWGMRPLPSTPATAGGPGTPAIGSWVFYTRGADRTTGGPETFLQSTSFEGGKRLWLSLLERMEAWVNGNGGKARAVRPEFQKVVGWPGSYWETVNQAVLDSRRGPGIQL